MRTGRLPEKANRLRLFFDYLNVYGKKLPVVLRGATLEKGDCLVVLNSGYIGSLEEAQDLHHEWAGLEELYSSFGLDFTVAPRCDDDYGISRKGMWEYSTLFRDFLLNQSLGRRLVLINFSAGGPIADMGIIRARGSPKPKPRIAATVYVEATHFGIPSSVVRRFAWPRSEFIRDLDPDSRFMREVSRYRQHKPRNCVEVSGAFSRLFPGVFAPRTQADELYFPDITHGEIEYNRKVHLKIISRIEKILGRPR